MTQSEESITLVTSYRFLHHDNRSFTFVQDDVLPSYTRTMDSAAGRNSLAHAVRLRILACRNDSNRKRIFSLQLAADSSQLTAINQQLIKHIQKRPLSRSFSLPLSLDHQVLEVVVQRHGSKIIIIYAVICLHIECIFTVEADILCQNDISMASQNLLSTLRRELAGNAV